MISIFLFYKCGFFFVENAVIMEGFVKNVGIFAGIVATLLLAKTSFFCLEEAAYLQTNQNKCLNPKSSYC